MKEAIVKILKKAIKEADFKLDEIQINNLLEKPKDFSKGEFSFPCFVIAKENKLPPHHISLKIREHINKLPKELDAIQTEGPYINFFTNKKLEASNLIKQINSEKENFGKGNLGKGKKVLVEFSSPNIAKPFGIGHLRSTIIGNSISKICEFQNYKTIKANYFGDWGTQFGKLMLGYEKFGDEKKLKTDSIKHLYEIYVKINKDKKYEEESREWFQKLEQGNKEAQILWNRFKEISLKEFNRIYELMGIKFDLLLSESEYNDEMKNVISELEKKKLLKFSQGANIVDLEEFNLGVSLIQKTDGSTLYATRDLASAISRKKKYKFDKMIYEVGQEQTLHFKQFFKILELMGYEWSKDCLHVSHGLYLGKDGKRLATRKGKTFFMEEIILETQKLAKKNLLKRNLKISKKNLDEKSLKIAIAAIYYGDLKNNRSNSIIFDLEKFVSFEGNTGPYLQYSYARASSILRKIKEKKELILPEELEDKEKELIQKISDFPNITAQAYNQMAPSIIASYAHDLSQIFNEFYHACHVVGSEHEAFRKELIVCFRQVLKNSLNLLGIETMEEM